MKILIRLLVTIIILLTGLASSQAQADVAPDKNNLFQLSIEDLLNINVSVASRFESSLIDTPSNVTIIHKWQLERWNVSSLWDLMARVPGVFPTLDRDQKVITSRGLVDGNTRGVLILINGIPFYDSHSLASRGIESPTLDLDLVQQVEVLRGPGGLSWTGNPLLAVINLKMKTASDSGKQINVFTGTEQTYGGSWVTGWHKGDWQFDLNASYYQSNGKTIDSLTSINPADDRIRLDEDFNNINPPFGRGTFLLDEHRHSFSIWNNTQYKDFSAQIFYMDFEGNNRQQEINSGRELLEDLNRGFVHLNYDWLTTPEQKLSSSYTIASHEMFWHGSGSSEPTIGLLRSSVNHTASLLYEQRFKQNKLNFSLDYLTRGFSKSTNSNPLVTPAEFSAKDEISLDQFNLVAQLHHQLSDTIELQVGGKWVHSRQGVVSLDTFDPQLVINWQRNSEQAFKLAYNEGTLRPDADQIHQGLDENSEEQKISSVDFIWYQQLNEGWTSTLNFFTQKLDDRIIQRSLSGVKSYGSIGDTCSKGITLELNGKIQDTNIWANLGYTDANYKGGAPDSLNPDSLRFSPSGQALAFPEWTLNFGVDFEWNKISLSPAIRYYSSITNRILSATDSPTQEAQYKALGDSIQFDINMSYSLTGSSKLDLFISNAFDDDTNLPTSVFNGYTEQYGRFTRLELKYRF